MLSVVSAEKATEILNSSFSPSELSERVSVEAALSRVLSEDVVSNENIPAFDRSVVDGFALRAADTYGASEAMPAMLTLRGEILMGERAEGRVNRGECIKISTGGMLPEGADSVIMCEYTDSAFDGMCLCLKSTAYGENVSKKGDDVKTGDVVLKKGSVVTSASVGVLCALGITHVNCVKKPSVGIISTGDEIIDYSLTPAPGQIRDINSVLLASVMKERGCDVISYGIVRDKKEDIEKVFGRALSECDLVLMSGGSSKGERDMTAEIISARGELLFHGLAMKPGKPTILGKCDNKAVFGLPGHPAAAYYVAQRIVVPYIKMLTGNIMKEKTVRCASGTDIPSNHGREEVLPVRIENGKFYPVFGKSGLVSLLSDSDGYIIIDRNREGFFAGEESEVFLTR